MAALITFFAITLLISWGEVSGQARAAQTSFNVVNFGAVGDGKTDDSQAFVKAWNSTCRASSSSELIIPEGKTFLLKPVQFRGPCKSTSLSLQILGELVASSNKSAFEGQGVAWLQFWNVNGLTVIGGPREKIDGQGSLWWSICSKDPQHCRPRPWTMMFGSCNNLKLIGLKLKDSPDKFIALVGGNNIEASNLKIEAPANSPNTDGIVIMGSTMVHIHDSNIATGDDCIAMSNHAHDVNITKVSCGPGHGISIGSLGNDTVEKVRVWNSSLTGTLGGVKIKTWQGGSGFARDILFENITVSNVSNPILIDQYYCPNRSCSKQSEKSALQISNVTYKQITGTSATQDAIVFNCSKFGFGCTNLEINQINIKSIVPGKQTFAQCINAHGGPNKYLNSPPVSCLS